jgi:hypothetical protein
VTFVAPDPSFDVETFVQDGFIVVRGAIPSSATAAVLEHLESAGGFLGADPWQIEQRSVYDMPILVDVVTEAVRSAFDAVAGVGQWHLAADWGFPCRFPGAMDPLWHIDGDWFTHHVWSGEQVVTPIFLWHDVGSEDAPTLLARGSHGQVARLLASHEPDGIPGDRIVSIVHETITVEDAVPATGTAGDVYICHPFLAHSFNPIGPRKRRVISNVSVHGRSPIDIRSPETPVARAVASALA